MVLSYFTGGAFEGVEDQVSPFGYGRGEGVDAGHGDPEWICSKEKPRYDQIFQSLNPCDGKVTGAGTQISPKVLSQLLNVQPHLRGTLVVDKALEALLSSTKNCSLLTELCMSLKASKDDQQNQHPHETENFDKIANALGVSAQNCNMIVQFLLNERTVHMDVGSHRMSPAVSIHSLNESIAIDESRIDLSRPASSNADIKLDSDEESDSDNEVPLLNLETHKEDTSGFFHPIIFSVKFIFLLALNILTLIITVQVMLVTILYVTSGELYIEFLVNKTPESWIDKAKDFAFGSVQESTRIHYFFELFYRHNLVNILKYVYSKVINS